MESCTTKGWNIDAVELLEELEDVILGENGEVQRPTSRGAAAAAELVGLNIHRYIK